MSEKYVTDEHGCLNVDGVYTGPIPQLEDASIEGERYPTDEMGNQIQDGEYSGPVPNESAKAQEAQLILRSVKCSEEKRMKLLFKDLNRRLRFEGYK